MIKKTKLFVSVVLFLISIIGLMTIVQQEAIADPLQECYDNCYEGLMDCVEQYPYMLCAELYQACMKTCVELFG